MGPMGPGWGGEVPWVFLVVLAAAILVGFVGVAVLTWRRRRGERLADMRLIERTRAVVRQQLDAVADDILNLEDSVRAAGNDEALAHYRSATIAYAAIVGEYETADAAQQLTNLAGRLDTAIWQLDAAEAILDGNPLPPQPQTHNAASSTAQPPYRQQRRPARSSAVGVIDVIAAILETGPSSAEPTRRRHHSRRRHC